MEINWRKFSDCVDWLFFTGASISLVMPFIPVYVEQLGTPKIKSNCFGTSNLCDCFASAVVAPIWGNLADRKGRKLMMIRAAAGMTLTMGSLALYQTRIGFDHAVWNGILSGYIPNATAMIASQAPRERADGR